MRHNIFFRCQVLHVFDLHMHMLAEFESSGGNVSQLAVVAFSETVVYWSVQVCVQIKQSLMFNDQGK